MPGNCTVPASFDDLDRKGRKPFKRTGPCLAGLVNGNSRNGGTTLARILVLRIDELKSIILLDVCNNRLNCSCLHVLEARAILIEDVRVTQVQDANIYHYHQEKRDDNLAMAQIHEHPVKAQAKLHDWFRVPLYIVRDGYKSGESVSDRVRTAVLI